MGKVITETKRIIIREFDLGDAEDVYCFGRDPRVTKYTGDAGKINTLDDARQVITTVWLAEYALYGYARWALEDKASGRVIGFCGFKYETRIGATDLGYRLLPEYWGIGIATEVCQACLAYAREHMSLERVIGEAVVDNHASTNVLQKLGFELVTQYQEQAFLVNRYQLSLT